jgi:3-methyladenine DNA glycosylase AlkD
MARDAIPSDRAFGVPMAKIQELGKRLGRDHGLALALWETGWYEARIPAAFVGEPERATPAQMDRWARDFDRWAICDTLCFKLFDRTPHAFAKVAKWAECERELVKRAAFALPASLALHDRDSADSAFSRCLSLVERGARDERNLVKKGVSWALRAIGPRSAALNAASVALARRLAEAPSPAARWAGKDALRDLAQPALVRRLAARGRTARA